MSEANITPDWERRFRAPYFSLPCWSRTTPDRVVLTSNEGESFQASAWDLITGERRKISHEPVGLQIEAGIDASPTADGSGVVWFRDTTGDESGLWVVAPWEGGEAVPLLQGVPVGWPAGLALGRHVVAATMSTEDGYRVWVSVDGAVAAAIHHHTELVDIPWNQWGGNNNGGLSADETLLAVQHGENGNYYFLELRVFDPRTGDVIGELFDGEGNCLTAQTWSPVPGDQRLAFRANRTGWDRPGIWNPVTGDRVDFDFPGMDGDFEVFDWWPDASALLVNLLLEGRDRLYRLDVHSGELEQVSHPEGTILGAQVRPDGEIWMRHEHSTSISHIINERGEEIVAPVGPSAPAGHAFRSFNFRNPSGDDVHGFLVMPEGEGPFPLALDVHGGPEWLWADQWHPKAQALVDIGLAVALINFRGSIGYGRDWKDCLIGNVGFFELEDELAGLDHLIAEGIADPDRVVLMGRSWGGYITLLGLGMYPDRFMCGAAGVPVGDYIEAFVDSAPSLQAMDRALLGGAAPDMVEFITPRSPITYVSNVEAPVHIQYGENDTRCPPRQVRLYIEALRGEGGEVEVDVYATGHGSFIVEEEVRQWSVVLDFLARKVPGLRRP